jgi:hypothetical protein
MFVQVRLEALRRERILIGALAVARTTFPVTDVEANVRHFVKAVKAGQAALAADNTSVKRGKFSSCPRWQHADHFFRLPHLACQSRHHAWAQY